MGVSLCIKHEAVAVLVSVCWSLFIQSFGRWLGTKHCFQSCSYGSVRACGAHKIALSLRAAGEGGGG